MRWRKYRLKWKSKSSSKFYWLNQIQWCCFFSHFNRSFQPNNFTSNPKHVQNRIKTKRNEKERENKEMFIFSSYFSGKIIHVWLNSEIINGVFSWTSASLHFYAASIKSSRWNYLKLFISFHFKIAIRYSISTNRLSIFGQLLFHRMIEN